MSTITYTALREIEKTGYVKAGNDIFASATDDSLGATVTDLSGLLADQWVKVTGFLNAENNGWFQVSGDSTTTKIVTITPPIAYVRLPATADNFVSTPDSGAVSVIGDLDLRMKIAADDWTPAALADLLDKSTTDSSGFSYLLRLNADGTLALIWSADGAALNTATSTANLSALAAFSVKYVRATLDADNGAAGRDIKFWTSDDGVTWVQLGATVTQAGVTSIFDSASPVSLGRRGTTTPNFAGKVYVAQILNGIDGTVVAQFEAELALRGATSVVAGTGETWTLSQSGAAPAAFQGRALVAEAAGQPVTITGHVRGFGETYALESGIERADRGVQVRRFSRQPIGGGAPEVIHQRSEVFINVGTGVIPESKIQQWEEFLASVEGGETFVFDRYGTIAAPVVPKIAQLASDSYFEQREGSNFRYRIGFTVRVLD